MWQNTPDFVAWLPQIGDILWQITFILKQKAVRNAQLFFDLKVVVIEKLPQEGRN